MSTPAALVSPGTYITELKGGRKVVTTGGTAEQLTATDTNCQGAILQALRTNTGTVAVGGSDVNIAAGGENGIILTAGQTMTLFTTNLTRIWIDAENDSEGVNYLVLKG
jgi:hypothetical protein